MIIPVAIEVYPQTIKKTDLDTYLSNRRKGYRVSTLMGILGLLVMHGVFVFVYFTIIADFYKTTSQEVPLYPLFGEGFLIGLGLMSAIMVLRMDPLNPKKVAELKASSDELLSINSSVRENTLVYIVFGNLVLGMISWFLLFLLPIIQTVGSS